MYLKVSYFHQGCIYLIKNAVKTMILWFFFEYNLKCHLFLTAKINDITPVFSVIQKFLFTEFVLNTHLLLSMLKTVVLYNYFV